MADAAVRVAIISTDEDFRRVVRDALAASDLVTVVGPEITVSFTEISDTHLEELREEAPDVVLVDLESDPHVGLKFAQYLQDAGTVRSLLAAGPTDSPDLLLSAMQAGVAEYLPKPPEGDRLEEAIGRALRRSGRSEGGPAPEERRSPAELIPVFAAKGGIGSTTVATNLAIEIHRLTRKKTLLVDFDLELGETALLLGIEPRFSVVDLVKNFHRVDSNLLASYIERHETGVELLSAPYQPADVEAVSEERMRKILRFLRGHYDYLVVDMPKTFSPATLVALEEAERAYLVTVADIPSLRNLTRCLPLLQNLGRRKAADWLRLLLNRYEAGDVITTEEVEETVGMKVFATLSNDYRAVMRSLNTGKPVVTERRSSFARDLRQLAGRITDVQVADKGGSWLSSFLSPFRNGRRESEPNQSKSKVKSK